MQKYIALQSVGAFLPGDEIKGLNEDRIQALLVSGAVEEYKPPEQTQHDDSSDELDKLKGQVEELKAFNKQLETDKTTALSEIKDLKAKVSKLEVELAAATAKTPKSGKAAADENADKGAADTK